MAFLNLVTLAKVKNFLGIDDTETNFDDQIISIIPFYVGLIKRTLGINLDTLEKEDQEFMVSAIAVAIGCHLTKSDRSFGMKYSSWKLEDASKNFARRYKTDYDNWCDFYEDILGDLMDFFAAETGDLSVERPTVTDSFSQPWASD